MSLELAKKMYFEEITENTKNGAIFSKAKPKASLLYKEQEKIIYSVNVNITNSNIHLRFSCDGGKHGTDELLDEFEFSIKDLLSILQKNEIPNNLQSENEG